MRRFLDSKPMKSENFKANIPNYGFSVSSDAVHVSTAKR
jgi:hypothetical protein